MCYCAFEVKEIVYLTASLVPVLYSKLSDLSLRVCLVEALFPHGHVHAHKSRMVLDSATCNEKFSGLRGQQWSVGCIRLAPVFQPHYLRQTDIVE